MIVARTRAELAQALAGLDAGTGTGRGRRAVVMTMGALHPGHMQLVARARERADHVITTIFVNPLQFGAGEDFGAYPRTLQADLDACEAAGVAVVFAPSEDAMYPEPLEVRVAPGLVAEVLEGAARPGHFSGMLTVVCKLLNLTRADVALFGEKDYQQLALIRLMVRDLDLGVEIVGVPTVRDADGIAMSSRNRYLSGGERDAALAIPRAIQAGAAAAVDGPDAARQAAEAVLAAEPGVLPDYVAVTGVDLGPAPDSGQGRILIAARVGSTRLLDNAPLTLGRLGR